jgi:hypothetical protein
MEALRKKAIQDETHFTTKIGEKLVWVPIISLCKIYIPSYTFDALLSRNYGKWQNSASNVQLGMYICQM